MDSEKIIRENYLPQSAVGDSWANRRDHDAHQLIVSIQAQIGGVQASSGCPTPGAESARSAAEERFYRFQENPTQKYFKKNN